MDETKALHWSPRFDILSPAENQLLLLGEIETFFFQGESYQYLFAQIDGTKSSVDILAPIEDFGKQAALLMTLERLLEARFLEEVTASATVPVYHRPDFRAEPVIEPDRFNGINVVVLSQFENREVLQQWTEVITTPELPGIVIVDDYLDPRLTDINRRYLQQSRSWLLVKPTGQQPLIGPYFTPDTPKTPCWACLAARLRYNHPVRRWLQGAPGTDMRPVPIYYDVDSVTRVLAVAALQAQSLIDFRFNHGLYAIDTESGALTEHPVIHLPQCVDCGDPYLFTQRSAAGLSISSSPKMYTQDGGFRSRTPTQTHDILQPIISPLTGVVHDLEPLPDQAAGGVTIYRSSFFTTPWSKRRFDRDDFVQISLGKGVAALQSQVSALCESVERYAAQYQGDEPHHFGPASGLDTRAILPRDLAPFSERQYQQFRDAASPGSSTPQAVEPHDPEASLHWTLGRSLTRDASVYIPLTYCYANTPFTDERYIGFDPNGCAAGNTLAEAVLQGFLELVERDAVAVWWYNRIPRPAVALEPLPADLMRPIRASLDHAWEYWVLDLTHDFELPVMAAISRHRETRTYRIGFGCHLDPRLACLRALTELCQLIAIGERGAGVFDFSQIAAEPYLLPKADTVATRPSDFDVMDHIDIRDDVYFCIRRAAALGLETIVVNSTRPDLPIHTAKVIVPGLCHIWPRLGAERLYTVPRTLGWHTVPLQEHELNPLALFL